MQCIEIATNLRKSEYDKVSAEYEGWKAKGLKLNMARGKPSKQQLDLVSGILTALTSAEECVDSGVDARNYGELKGLESARALFAEILGCKTSQVFAGGNSSLQLMYDTVSKAYTHGLLHSEKPWCKEESVKWLCPAPGYDRHFRVSQSFGMELIPISMTPDGPDMDAVEAAVRDPAVKGIWCVPKYSNPQGYTYSDETVRRFANLKPAAKDFRIFWDNAYGVHHLYDHDQDHLIEILAECKRAGNPDLVYKFASTSKISFPGSGIAAIATSHNNLEDIKAQLKNQTIGHDKVNQLRHVRFFKDIHGMVEHMRKHADIIRPKFEAVEEILERELGGLGIGEWTKPKGGYFISFDSLDGCAKDIVARCKKAGVVMTGAGATYPYGKDPHDSNIRIAPTYPPLGDLIVATELFALCVKLTSAEKLLKEMEQNPQPVKKKEADQQLPE